MKFNYKPGKESYIDFLKKKIWVKKKSKKKEESKEKVEVLDLNELNK